MDDRLFELSLDPLCLVGFDGRLIALNSAWQRILQHNPLDLAGTEAIFLVHPDDRDRVSAAAAVLPAGKVAKGTVRVRDGNGDYRPMHVRAEPAGSESAACLVLREISAYEERDFIRAILTTTPALMLVTDAHGSIVEFNRAAEELTGRPFASVDGRALWDVGITDEDPAELAALYERLSGGDVAVPLTWESEWKASDGSARRIVWHASVLTDDDDRIVHVVMVGEDVTENRSLQEQLLQSQKMEAVGRLAGGVAHDFNNILSVVLNHAQFALEGIEPGTETFDDVQQIHEAATRAASLTRQLLLFSRQDAATPERLNVNRTVADMKKLLLRVLGEDIKLDTDLPEDLWPVRVARSHLEQALINLAVNARDAMPSGGELFIRTANVRVGPAHGRPLADLEAGRYVRIEVTDTGSGIGPGVVEHVFEPFFTTKEMGAGTGLGLAIVYGLVKQVGGGVRVDSELGRGAMFTLYLPALDPTTEPKATQPTSSFERGHGERILVVEDERAVRRAVARLLRRNHYDVVEAASGEEAISLLASGDAVDLVLSDVVMPGVSGTEMAAAIAQSHPGLPVVYMSGYTADFLEHHGAGDVLLLQKPFEEADLMRLIRRALLSRS